MLNTLSVSVEIGAAAAIFGVTVGSAAAALFLITWLLRHRLSSRSGEQAQHAGPILKKLLLIGVPITLGSSVMSIITLVDQTVVMARLQNGLGLAEQAAAALYGQYTFGMTLFNLPATFVYPVTVSLIPAVSAALTRQNTLQANRIISSSFRLIALFSLPAGVGLSVLAQPILQLLYPAVPDTAAAAAYHLQILGAAAVFVCLMILTNAILQACGRVYVPIVTALIGGAVKISTTYTPVRQSCFRHQGRAHQHHGMLCRNRRIEPCAFWPPCWERAAPLSAFAVQTRAGCGTDGRVRSLRLSFSAHGGRSFPAVGCSGRNCARRQFLCFSGPPSAHGHTGRSRVDSKRRKNCKNPAHSLKNAPPAGICVGFIRPGRQKTV